eukprot:COSAG02_NODE_3012_length_7552_cov_13.461827_8_plen_69_part_00
MTTDGQLPVNGSGPVIHPGLPAPGGAQESALPLALRLPNSFETFECLVELLCSPSKPSSVPELYSSDP